MTGTDVSTIRTGPKGKFSHFSFQVTFNLQNPRPVVLSWGLSETFGRGIWQGVRAFFGRHDWGAGTTDIYWVEFSEALNTL